MNLTHLTDKALLADTKSLMSKERQITVNVLFHLKEIDTRKLYSDLKYPSLYEYCIKELKLSEGGAQRRITACRMINEMPSIAQKIEVGSLSLSNLASVSKFIKDRDIRQTDEKLKIVESVEHLSKRECDQKLFDLCGLERPKTTILTIKDETFILLQKAKSLFGKPISQDDLLQMLINDLIAKIEKEKFKQTRKERLPPPAEVSRVIPAHIKREVYQRDEGKCVLCGSTHNLNYDHIIPYALGGKSTLENIRLLCFNCNQRSRIRAKL